MNYELLKQLKEAGFPQDKLGQCPTCGSFENPYHDPTLSELIEACGDNFHTLCKGWKNQVPGFYADNWPLTTPFYEVFGKTPKEAVANLYLALNKKG